jgi:hypothetical protein
VIGAEQANQNVGDVGIAGTSSHAAAAHTIGGDWLQARNIKETDLFDYDRNVMPPIPSGERYFCYYDYDPFCGANNGVGFDATANKWNTRMRDKFRAEVWEPASKVPLSELKPKHFAAALMLMQQRLPYGDDTAVNSSPPSPTHAQLLKQRQAATAAFEAAAGNVLGTTLGGAGTAMANVGFLVVNLEQSAGDALFNWLVPLPGPVAPPVRSTENDFAKPITDEIHSHNEWNYEKTFVKLGDEYGPGGFGTYYMPGARSCWEIDYAEWATLPADEAGVQITFRDDGGILGAVDGTYWRLGRGSPFVYDDGLTIVPRAPLFTTCQLGWLLPWASPMLGNGRSDEQWGNIVARVLRAADYIIATKANFMNPMFVDGVMRHYPGTYRYFNYSSPVEIIGSMFPPRLGGTEDYEVFTSTLHALTPTQAGLAAAGLIAAGGGAGDQVPQSVTIDLPPEHATFTVADPLVLMPGGFLNGADDDAMTEAQPPAPIIAPLPVAKAPLQLTTTTPAPRQLAPLALRRIT